MEDYENEINVIYQQFCTDCNISENELNILYGKEGDILRVSVIDLVKNKLVLCFNIDVLLNLSVSKISYMLKKDLYLINKRLRSNKNKASALSISKVV